MKNNLAKAVSISENVCSESRQILKQIVNACMDAKAKDPLAVQLDTDNGMADYFVAVSGRSDRQVQGITNRVLEEAAKIGVTPNNIEGYDTGHWVLLDFGDVILHVFYEPMREHYDIESLWHDMSPVSVA